MNRRIFLHGVITVLAGVPLARLTGETAWAQAPARYSRIVVDTKPLEQRGGSYSASIIRPQLQAALQREFAGSIGRGGPVLTVRVNTVLLNGAPAGGRRDGGGPVSDYLEAEVTTGTLHFPLLVTQDALTAGGASYLPGYEERRLRALADSLASWVRRRV
ncbi:MAG: hypothetical protein IT539_01880 [Bradyrhizobiaceae bacterium]|nr:hypothetical protein [Bradyrhizobiaceae bacterium]